MNKFKILFLYPNDRRMSMPPPSIALFSRLLKEKRFEVGLFDASHYDVGESSNEVNVRDFVHKPYDDYEKYLPIKSDMYGDFKSKVDTFKPNLIAITSTESTFMLAIDLLKSVGDRNISTILGGVFATFAPDVSLSYPEIDMLCIGEGEYALTELCERMSTSNEYLDVNNLWIKHNDTIIHNPISPPIDINKNPIPDYELFDDNRFYRAMSGKMYKMLPIETHRGCLFTCGFCNSPSQNRLYLKETGSSFFRKKSIDKVRDEIEYCCETMKAKYLFFWADDFFSYNKKEIDQFCDMYSEFELPFFCQARPETATDYKIKKLKSVGLDRMTVGIEHGNEKFRKDVLGRAYSNKKALKAIQILLDNGIQFSVNNIIGYPTETRSLIMDTIEFNRQIKDADSRGCYVFSPYHGTALRELAIKFGYLNPELLAPANADVSILNMPDLTPEQLLGLRHTFNMYIDFPKEKWDEIRIAEEPTEEGKLMLDKLRSEYAIFLENQENDKSFQIGKSVLKK